MSQYDQTLGGARGADALDAPLLLVCPHCKRPLDEDYLWLPCRGCHHTASWNAIVAGQEDEVRERLERGPWPYDTPCPECKYNLRTQPGDPARCPECGTLVPRRLLLETHFAKLASWWVWRKQPLAVELRRLVALASGIALLLAAVVLLALSMLSIGRWSEAVWGAFLNASVFQVCVGLVIAGLVLFKTRGRGEHLMRFVRYQPTALLSLLVNVPVAVIPGVIIVSITFFPISNLFVAVVAFAVILLLQPIPVFREYRRELLRPLAEEIVARRARKAATRTGEARDE